MNLSDEIEVETIELPDALEFTLKWEIRLWQGVLGPAIILVVLSYYWFTTRYLIFEILIGAVVFFGVGAYALKQGGEMKLRVESDGLRVVGNQGFLFSKNFELAATDITRIRYFIEPEGGSGGLYVWHGWATACLLPGLSAMQSDMIVSAISKRFPHLPTELSSSAGWRGEKLIELGLSKLDREDSDSKS